MADVKDEVAEKPTCTKHSHTSFPVSEDSGSDDAGPTVSQFLCFSSVSANFSSICSQICLSLNTFKPRTTPLFPWSDELRATIKVDYDKSIKLLEVHTSVSNCSF